MLPLVALTATMAVATGCEYEGEEVLRAVARPVRPTRGQRLASALLRLFGWRLVFAWPPRPRTMIVFYPHTSNWDFVVGIVARFAAGIPVRWVAKDTLFRGPTGSFFRALGGIPVNRRERTGFVDQLVDAFARHDQLFVVIAPEGTRKRTDHWKSGFYRAAVAAGVPLGLAFIDYPEKQIGIDTYFELSGDEQEDLARIRAYYQGKRGRYPEHAGDIRLQDRRERPR